MNINLHPGRAVTFAALAVTLLTVAGPASASSVTYNFTQSAFSDGTNTGVLDGTFTATPEADGNITAADLTSFLAVFKETVGGTPENFQFSSVNDFSYNPNTPGSFGFSAGSLAENIIICSGSADVNNVCYGFTSPISPKSSAAGFFEDLPDFPTSLTKQIAVVTPGAGSTSATPEPGTSALFATAGLLLIGAGRWKHRTRNARLHAISEATNA